MEPLKIVFYKYHGTGNDFILIDNRELRWEPTQQKIAFLCNRHLSIGADGLMLLNVARGYDFGMSYYNSDGNESTMCGNGGRCMTAFARSLGLIGEKALFKAVDGDHEAVVLSANDNLTQVRLKMKDTSIGKVFPDGIFLDTGSPHFVRFVEAVQEMDICTEGRKLRYDSRFAPGGTNVDFAEVTGQGLFVRTYERGVEDETLSCGTGVTAAALAHAFNTQSHTGETTLSTTGGTLKVIFCREEQSYTGIWLEGPAKFVFSGEIIPDPPNLSS